VSVRGWILGGAAIVVGLTGLAAFAVRKELSWVVPTDPFQIADNLYYVGSAGVSAFLIKTSDGAILIDGGMPGGEKRIEKSLATLGFKPTDVKILLNTHAHFDHAGDFAALKRDTGAILAASAGDRKALETGTYIGSEDVGVSKFPPVKVDRVLADGDVVTLGGVSLTAHVTPGHTAGCTSWTFPIQYGGQTKQVFVSCSTSVGVNRLVSKTKGPQYPGIVADYEKTFARLKTFRADIYLAPHNEQFGMAQKRAKMVEGLDAFVDPNELQARVAASEADFRRALAKQQEAAK